MIYTKFTEAKEAEEMATKVINFKMDEDDIIEMKNVADVFNLSVTDFIKNAINEYEESLKSDPFYRLSAYVKEASASESKEILSSLEKMSDDDLKIVSKKRFTV